MTRDGIDGLTQGHPYLRLVAAKPTRQDGDFRRLIDEGHVPRASDVYELRALQKERREKDDAVLEAQHASISATLRSATRDAGPRVMRSEEAARRAAPFPPGSPKAMGEHSTSGFVKASEGAGGGDAAGRRRGSRAGGAELYEKILRYEKGAHIMASGAVAVLSGAKTGSSPKDKRLVRERFSNGDVWWGEGSPNIEMDAHAFDLNRERAVDFLNTSSRLYVVDGFVGWQEESRYRVRVVCSRPAHALFAHNMLVRPTEEELAEFGRPNFTILDAGTFPANRFTSCNTSSTSIDLSLRRRELVGAGKSTLMADPDRSLIGGHEICWGELGVSNLEGGCYAKAIGLTQEREPGTWAAVRFGTLLENVCFDEEERTVDWDNRQAIAMRAPGSITENTRACFPLDYVPGAILPAVGPHPAHAILLCCDAFGVLPPVARLSLEQALYYFLRRGGCVGYTAKVAATSEGVSQPEATFSPCFAADMLVMHPFAYAAILARKLEQHGSRVWLVNTGWTGGAYGAGRRIRLAHTRAIVAAIHSGELEAAQYQTMPVFQLEVPLAVAGVPAEELQPSAGWASQAHYDAALHSLARLFAANFESLAAGDGHADLAARVAGAGPQL
eukprot:scaffold2.g7376.t1